jgi:two-component system NtrC family response regulator
MDNPVRRPSVLIIDDEPNFNESLQIALEDAFEVATAPSLSGARESLKGQTPDAILLDIRLPDGNGIDFLQELKDIDPKPVVIVMTAYVSIGDAIAALKEGAADYFTKPLDLGKLKRELNVYLENKLLQKKITSLDREIKKILPPFVTSGEGRMRTIVDKVPMVASSAIPVLIKGETGTGKEKLAEWIHALSGSGREMVAINCSALPKDIFESELFGHTKGAFSGALAFKEGLVERADGGTLFLDEIGELPEAVQAKLLRVIEDGVYYKVGDPKERRVRFRLISATNKDLIEPSGSFRSDLFYRINGVTFEMPPLRERREDIPLLVSTFIKEANIAHNKNVTGVSKKIMEHLMQYTWPGNIRELKWSIHRAVAVSSKNVVDVDEIFTTPELSKNIADAGEHNINLDLPFQEAIERLERRYIESALAAAHNNKTEAARMLGISVRVLHYKVKQYKL